MNVLSDPFLLLFGVLFVSVFVWFFLVSRLYRLLRINHPARYEAMGKPTLFLNNPPKASWVLIRFLVSREYAQLDDVRLTRLANGMLVFLALYLLGFFVLVLGAPRE